MLKEKRGQFWNLHQIANKTSNPDFFLQVFSGLKKSNCNFIWKSSIIKKIRRKWGIWICAEFDADSKTVLVFLLALIVFDFYSFEGRKTNFSGDAYKHIYIYNYYYFRVSYLYECVYSRNHMCLYDIQTFMLHFTFYSPLKLVFFYALETMTSPWYYDVTFLFTDPDKICTAYVKLNSKHILFVRIFWFSIIFNDNYDYSYIYIYTVYIYIGIIFIDSHFMTFILIASSRS